MNPEIEYSECKENNAFKKIQTNFCHQIKMLKCDKNEFLVPVLNMGDKDAIFQSKNQDWKGN
jgi:hypothetical protein